MEKRLLLSILALVAMAATAAAPDAHAQVQFVQTDCDTASIDPPLVLVSFSITNLMAIPLCEVILSHTPPGPGLPDSCYIHGCGSPQEGYWQCEAGLMTSGSAIWRAMGPPCILPGATQGAFVIGIDPSFCCYQAHYIGPEGPISDTVCFTCEKPVQTLGATWGATWGSVKSFYR